MDLREPEVILKVAEGHTSEVDTYRSYGLRIALRPDNFCLICVHISWNNWLETTLDNSFRY